MPRPLTKAQEEFAQAIANAESGADAYAKIHPKASRKTCTEQASRIARQPNISARIDEIRAQRVTVSEKAQAHAIEKAAKKLGEVLLSMSERRQLLAARARKPKISESALCCVLRLDAQLAGELIDKTDLTTDGEALPSVMPQIIVSAPSVNRRRAHLRN